MRCCRRGAGRRLAEWIAQLRSSGATRTPRALRARWIRCCTIIRSDGKRQPLAIHRRPRFKGDGKFYYSVATTGVYCRPSCAARLPRPENVRFHASRKDAEIAGFRPCKRCKPDQPSLVEQNAIKVAEV